MILLITYDLNTPGQSYNNLYKAIKDSATISWLHLLDSAWLVDTSLTPEQVSAKIQAVTDKGDHHLVIRVTREYEGWLKQDAWDWIKGRQY